MGPRPFRYEAATSIEDAIEHLRRSGAGAKILAGGQSLVPMMNLRLIEPEIIVDINALDLSHIHRTDRGLILGALVRHHVLEEDKEVRALCPLLSEAASLIGNLRIRNLGTLGGSLAHGDPAAELPMASLALDAEFLIRGPSGSRVVRANEFFVGTLQTALEPAEILVEVRVPVKFDREGWAVEEFARRSGDFAIVASAIRLTLDGDGRIEMTRISLAGVGPTPVCVPEAEDLLLGRPPDPEHLDAAARTAAERVCPDSDIYASSTYRRHLVRVLVLRGLRRAVSRALYGE